MTKKEYALITARSEYMEDGTITTNWPYKNERPKQPKRLGKTVYYVNSPDGITIGEFTDRNTAYEFLKTCCSNSGYVQVYCPDGDTLDQEAAIRRAEARYQGGFGA